jgi:hypothetical protein
MEALQQEFSVAAAYQERKAEMSFILILHAVPETFTLCACRGYDSRSQV